MRSSRLSIFETMVRGLSAHKCALDKNIGDAEASDIMKSSMPQVCASAQESLGELAT